MAFINNCAKKYFKNMKKKIFKSFYCSFYVRKRVLALKRAVFMYKEKKKEKTNKKLASQKMPRKSSTSRGVIYRASPSESAINRDIRCHGLQGYPRGTSGDFVG